MANFLLDENYSARIELLMDVPFWNPQDETRALVTELPIEGALGYAGVHPEFPRLPLSIVM